MKSFKTLILIITLTLSSTYAVSATLEKSDLENFDSLWESGFNQGNIDSLMRLYTVNAVVFPPSSEILKGRTIIGSYLKALKEVGVNEFSISNVDVDIKDNIAYETALWETSRTGAEGNIIKLEGNISNVYEKQKDGSWKIKLQSWN